MSPPALTELINGYFHQDWDTYGSDDEEVVRAFVADDPQLARSTSRRDRGAAPGCRLRG